MTISTTQYRFVDKWSFLIAGYLFCPTWKKQECERSETNQHQQNC